MSACARGLLEQCGTPAYQNSVFAPYPRRNQANLNFASLLVPCPGSVGGELVTQTPASTRERPFPSLLVIAVTSHFSFCPLVRPAPCHLCGLRDVSQGLSWSFDPLFQPLYPEGRATAPEAQ